jgi:exodeoxyribonuclease VII large subunit
MLQERRLGRGLRVALDDARRRLDADVGALAHVSPAAQIANRRQQLDELTRAAASQLQRRITLQRAQLHGAVRHLEALNPHATLERGYAIVRLARGGEVVTSQSQIATNVKIRVRVHDGEFGARVE